jgi:hypothetical protein
MENLLRIGVLVTATWALLALTVLVIRARMFGKGEQFARAAGSPTAGVVYAFGPGMSPTAKESAREHLPTYFGGVGYHLGVFAGLAFLLMLGSGIGYGGTVLRVLQVLTLAGALCGVGLLVKRLLHPHLRGLSCPDDYVANLLTTGFAGFAFAASVFPALQPAFLAESALLLLYLPLGKIKHCFFFLTTRYYLGAHFGRRGTFPPRVVSRGRA